MFKINYFLLEAYQVFCWGSNGRACYISPGIPARTTITLFDQQTSTSDPVELTLSSDLIMFLTYLLRFVIFHGLGLLLCWICTMSFRGSGRR